MSENSGRTLASTMPVDVEGWMRRCKSSGDGPPWLIRWLHGERVERHSAIHLEAHASLEPKPSKAMASPVSGRQSPTGIDDTLEYFTVDNYEWPKYEAPKRPRLEEEERKKRHREVQRQFMRRKRAREEVLKSEIRHLELQLRIITASKEVKALVEEGLQLRTGLGPNIDTPLIVANSSAEEDVVRDDLDDPLLVEVLMSW